MLKPAFLFLGLGLLSAACGVKPPCAEENMAPGASSSGQCCVGLAPTGDTCLPEREPACASRGQAPASSRSKRCCDKLEEKQGLCQMPDVRPPCAAANQAPSSSQSGGCCMGLTVPSGGSTCQTPDTRPPCAAVGMPPSSSQSGGCCMGLTVPSGGTTCQMPDTRPRCSTTGMPPSGSQSGQCCDDYSVPSGGTTCQPNQPDLTGGGFSITHTIPPSGVGTLYLCLNRTPSGTNRPNGDHVRIRNIGRAASAPYSVAVGLINRDDSSLIFETSQRLVSNRGTPAGDTSEWLGGWCGEINAGNVPRGFYHVFTFADAANSSGETKRDNNASLTQSTIYVP